MAPSRKINAPFMAPSLGLLSQESDSLQLRNSHPETCHAADRVSRAAPILAMTMRLQDMRTN
jgi:hypothetical protein